MRFSNLVKTSILFTGLASVSQAQDVHFNEIYASHSGIDTNEFIELVGTPGLNLTGIVVAMVEGQGGGQGTLDRVWDLTGQVIPADGYFVMGNVAVANVDYTLAQGPHFVAGSGGTADNIENGTETFYLLSIPNPLDIADLENTLYNTNIDPDVDLVTALSSFTVLENLTMMTVLNDPHDLSHDCGVELGPDGTFFPAGIFRPGDYPNEWCADTWLDFGGSSLPGTDNTPGTANQSTACATTIQSGPGCGGTNPGVGVPFCDPMDNNSTGMPTVLTATMTAPGGSGLHLEATQGPVNQFGYFLIGTGSNDPGLVVSQGRLCLDTTGGNQFGRYNVTSSDLNSVGLFDANGILQNAVSTSSVGSGYDVPSNIPISGQTTIMMGETWHFQLWHRENGGVSTFSNGLSVTF